MRLDLISSLEESIPDQTAEPLVRNLLDGHAGSLTLPDFQRLLSATRGKWALGVMLLQGLRQRDLQPSTYQWQRNYGWMAMACETAGLWSKALDLLENMVARRLEINHIGETASGWRFRGGAGAAGSGQAQLSALKPSLRKLVILRLYTAKGRKDVEDVAVAAATLRRYGAPKPRDYVVLLSAYGAVHLWQSALGVLEEMQSLRFAPYIVSCNAALKACETSGQWSVALALFQSMRIMRTTPPDQISYTTLIRSLGRQKFWNRALQILAEMDCESTPDVGVYSAAMAACGKARKWWLALGLLAELEAKSLIPDDAPGRNMFP